MHKKPKEAAMLEFMTSQQIGALKSPRVLNTHYPPHLLPREIKKKKKTKIVYIYRNQKDVAISANYHFSKAMEMIKIKTDVYVFIHLTLWLDIGPIRCFRTVFTYVWYTSHLNCYISFLFQERRVTGRITLQWQRAS